MHRDPLISLKNVSLTLPAAAGPVEILKAISLDVMRGERLAVVGPSGSGKSTLLMLLAGLERPSAGQITIDGTEITSLSEEALTEFRRQTIGIVFQSFHLIPTMTALENVCVPLELNGHPDPVDAAKKQLDVVGLSHRLSHYPTQLSGGEQQRVALARAVIAGAPLILADEPTGNLDGSTGAHIADLLLDLSAQGDTTLVLITHDRSLAARCDRMVQIGDGQLLDTSAVAAQ